jgi:PAS domain S-box-containing protein
MRGVGSYDGYFTLVNAAYQELLGWSAEELMSVPYWEFIHPDDQDPLVESSQQLIDGTTSSRFGYEVRMLGRDGRYRWIRWNTKTIPQEQLLYAIGIDISDARPEDERIGVGSWEWRIATDEFHWSREMLDLLAITDEPPVRYETFLQWVHDEDRQRVDRDLRLTRTYGNPTTTTSVSNAPTAAFAGSTLPDGPSRVPTANPNACAASPPTSPNAPRRAEGTRTNHHTPMRPRLPEQGTRRSRDHI